MTDPTNYTANASSSSIKAEFHNLGTRWSESFLFGYFRNKTWWCVHKKCYAMISVDSSTDTIIYISLPYIHTQKNFIPTPKTQKMWVWNPYPKPKPDFFRVCSRAKHLGHADKSPCEIEVKRVNCGS